MTRILIYTSTCMGPSSGLGSIEVVLHLHPRYTPGDQLARATVMTTDVSRVMRVAPLALVSCSQISSLTLRQAGNNGFGLVHQ